MPSSRTIELLTRCHPYLGTGCWILTIQYFVAQIAATMATQSVYNWGTDPISYLGISECGIFNGDYICSPLHAVFNLSLIGLGVLMAGGAVLFYHQFRQSAGTLIGFGAMTAGGIGCMLVGLFPTNSLHAVHDLGSGLSFVGGLIGVFALSLSLRVLPRALRLMMLCCGGIALAGLVWLALIFFGGAAFKGAAERVSSFPEVLCLVMFGTWMLICHLMGRTPWLRDSP